MPRVTITVADKTPQPYRFSLERKIVAIGRGEDNDIVIDCASISGKHAEMHRVEGGYELRDCDSTNGIKLEGKKTRLITLKNGLDVLLGDVDFDFSLKDDELAILASEEALMESSVEPLPPIDEPEPEDDDEEDEDEEFESEFEDEDDEDEDDEPEEKPKRKSKRKPKKKPVTTLATPAMSGGVNKVVSILSAVLVIGAFVTGLAIRYHNETDSSFIKSVISHMSGSDKSDDSLEKEGK